MDGVLVDFKSAIDKLKIRDELIVQKYGDDVDNIPGIFSMMEPIVEMVDLFNRMVCDDKFDCYVLSTPPWGNPSAWTDKLIWIKKYLPLAHKRLILSHNKNLCAGDYLIDDRTANGVGQFKGKLIQYGASDFQNASHVEDYIYSNEEAY